MADTPYTLKQHDTWPPLVAVLSDADGPIDLTNASAVKFIAKSDQGLAITGACSIVTATEGRVRYTWAAGDTDHDGDYKVEFEITWGGTKVETVPNGSYVDLKIVKDLG